MPYPGGQLDAKGFIFVTNVWVWFPEHNWSGGQREFDITPFTEFSLRLIRDGFTEKVAVLLDFVQITSPPPSPQFGQLVPLFLNAKNVDFDGLKSIRGSWRDHFGGISGVLDTFRGL